MHSQLCKLLLDISEVENRFDYDMCRTVDSIRVNYSFEGSCQKSVPESIIAFLDSDSYEDAVRNAISMGGDADTMACIAGGIAQAYYKEIDVNIVEAVREKLPKDLLDILDKFCSRFSCEY